MKLFNMAIVAGALFLSGCAGWSLTDFTNGYPPGVCGWDYTTVTEKGEPMVGKDGVTVFYDDQSTITRTAIPCTDTPPEPPVCEVDCDPIPPCSAAECNPVPPVCTVDCDEVAQVGSNPGNGMPVGKSPWDGITGNSHKNDTNGTSPSAGPMDGQRSDRPYTQPGGRYSDGEASGKNWRVSTR